MLERQLRIFRPSRFATVCTIIFVGLTTITAPVASAPTFRTVPVPRATPVAERGVSSPSPYVSPGPVGAAVTGIAIALLPHKTPYHVGQPMYIGVYSENTSGKWARFRARSGFRLEVTSGAAPARHHAFVERSFSSPRLRDLSLIIPNGRSFFWADDLSETDDITQPGTYVVRALLTLNGSHAVVTSPTVTISVVQ